MHITNPKYIAGPEGDCSGIQATIDGKDMSVPLDPSNRHYKELMRQVAEEGLIIQEPEE